MTLKIWYPVKLIKPFRVKEHGSFDTLNRAVNLYVRFKEEEELYILWDGFNDFEYITVDEAKIHLEAKRDLRGKPI